MNLTKTIVLLLLVSKCTTSCAQNNYNWNNHKAAVALTYDDALYIHLDKVIPCLDSAGLKGTFYLVGSADPFTKRIADWRKAAAKGHELGNHTVFHPCYGKRPGREWVSNERDLNNYTLQRMTDEIKVNNALLEATDGKKKRTLACPCGDTKIGDSSYLYPLKDQFVAMRDGTPDAVDVNGFANVPVQWVSASQNTGAELIAAVKRAVESRALLIFVFHGVGGEHSINVSAEAHHELVQYLKQHKDEVWTAPFVEITSYIKSK